MQWLSSLLVPVIIAAFWFYTTQITRSIFPTLRRKRICLLIAHPDDEAMFFAPTLLALTAPDMGNHVKVLCLSSGDADGLGETRKKELAKSGVILGLRSEEDVLVVEDPQFPDSMSKHWDARDISDLLTKTFVTASHRSSSKTAPTPSIDVLITFDGHGVSSHVNHISLHHGARAFLSSLTKGQGRLQSGLAVYSLTTTTIIRKYLSVFDSALTMLHIILLRKKQREPPTPLLFLSSPFQYRTAQLAMTHGHQSQM
ncbi:MAG: N-acetylglucosaminyl-phosphatidylinositol de-N-acetylase, partial [Thelocarpon superellum]